MKRFNSIEKFLEQFSSTGAKHTFVILPTTLFKTNLKSFSKVIVYEHPHYINNRMHPMKLWFHRATMLEYYNKLDHPNKEYVKHNKKLSMKGCVSFDPIDYIKLDNIIESPGFLLKHSDMPDINMKTQSSFYRRMRIKYNILMDGDKPIGGKWSYDDNNREKYHNQAKDVILLHKPLGSEIMTELPNKYGIPKCDNLMYHTKRETILKHLKSFIKKISMFGPTQDAIDKTIVFGNHSCLSMYLNIGLITVIDVLTELSKVSIVNLSSTEGFIRQIIGWREYIRMKWVMNRSYNWSYLKDQNKSIPKAWYSGETGYNILDWCISRVITHAYVSHIERLMILLNYGLFLGVKYDHMKKFFVEFFIDGYDWVMVNVDMATNSLSDNKFMTRVYLTNGNYLTKMGLTMFDNKLVDIYQKFLEKTAMARPGAAA